VHSNQRMFRVQRLASTTASQLHVCIMNATTRQLLRQVTQHRPVRCIISPLTRCGSLHESKLAAQRLPDACA
jgi:hypothetical protein